MDIQYILDSQLRKYDLPNSFHLHDGLNSSSLNALSEVDEHRKSKYKSAKNVSYLRNE